MSIQVINPFVIFIVIVTIEYSVIYSFHNCSTILGKYIEINYLMALAHLQEQKITILSNVVIQLDILGHPTEA